MHVFALLAVAGVLNCGTAKSHGDSGNHFYVAGNGPLCLYRAYRRSCKPARLRITAMGIDTFASLTFTIRRTPCRVTVDGKNTVFAGSPHTHTWHQRCSKVVRRDGIAVTGCTGDHGDYRISPPPR
jgi:hypothetical protein